MIVRRALSLVLKRLSSGAPTKGQEKHQKRERESHDPTWRVITGSC